MELKVLSFKILEHELKKQHKYSEGSAGNNRSLLN